MTTLQEWQKIHPDFTEELVKEWKEKGFTYEQTREWNLVLDNYFDPVADAELCAWLRDTKNLTLSEVNDNFEDLWKEYKECFLSQYENDKFNFGEESDIEYLKEGIDAQEYLDSNYLLERRNTITKLDISHKNLTGSLIINDWPKLEKLDCRVNELTSLNLTNLPNLVELSCSHNRLTNLDFNLNKGSLTIIDIDISFNNLIGNSLLTEFSQFSNLLTLYLEDNNSLTGSLAPLQSCNKLEELRINNTKFTTGLELLPTSLEKLHCGNTIFEKELEDYKSEYNYYSYRSWREDYDKQQFQILKKEIQTLESDLNITENRIRVLQSLIQEQKAKIVEAYKAFAPEKELLQELIAVHLEYCKAAKGKKKNIVTTLRRQRDALRDELEKKIGDEFVDDIEFMLSDCDSLIGWMTELDEQLTKRQKLLEDQKQFLKLTNSDESRITELETKIKENEKQITNLEGQLTVLVKSPIKSLTYQIEELIINHGTYAGWKVKNSNIGSVGDYSTGTVTNNQQLQARAPQLPNKFTHHLKTSTFSSTQNAKFISKELESNLTQLEEISEELEKTEKQLQTYYENSEPSLSQTIKNFIETNRQFEKNKDDDKVRKDAEKLYEKLQSQGLSEEIRLIIEGCEKAVALELLLKDKQGEIENLQNQSEAKIIQLPPKW